MGYTTVEAVRNTGGCRSITAEDVPDSAIEQFILDAQRVIDGTLAREYSVPFADGSVPPDIELLCRWGAAWFTMSEYSDQVFELDLANAEKRYNDMLRRLRRGEMDIVGATRNTSTSDEIGSVAVSPSSRWSSR